MLNLTIVCLFFFKLAALMYTPIHGQESVLSILLPREYFQALMFQPGWKVKCHPAVASGSMSLQINAFEGHLSRPLPHLVGTGLQGRKWVLGRQVRVASSVLTTTPHRRITSWTLSPVRSAVAFVGTQTSWRTAHPGTQVRQSLCKSSPNHLPLPSPHPACGKDLPWNWSCAKRLETADYLIG